MAWSEGALRGLAALGGYLAPPLVTLTVAGLVWEIWTRVRDVPPYIVPAPSLILTRLSGDPGFFAREGLVTTVEALGGFALGSGVALLGATLMAHSRFMERSLLPLAILVKVTPVVAVAPLFVIWFGFGSMPKILIAALITFFPVLVNAVIGFRSVDPVAMDFLRSLKASQKEIFLTLRLPSSMPYLFSAFRVAIPLSIIGAVVGEWFSADKGLGSVIIVANSNLDMATLFAAILTLAFIGISLTVLLSLVERRVLFWHESALTS
ncbi:MAG: ABC transporter permease [Chloroflexi bacterium]|nr:ABC transporter permease [Chloroflexota bacterium]